MPNEPQQATTAYQLRIHAGPGGKAVRLADLARELMERYGMARQDAVLLRLLPPLMATEPPALYFLQPGGNAVDIGAIEWFGTGDGNPWPGRRYRTTPAAPSCGRGVAGAVEWLRGVWGNAANTDSTCFGRDGGRGYVLAVSEADAVKVWGWGEVAVPVPDVLSSVDGLKARLEGRRKRAPWQDDEVAFLRAEFHRLGGWRTRDGGKTWSKVTSVQTELAKKLGRERPALDRHLEGGPDQGAAAFQAVSGVLSGTR